MDWKRLAIEHQTVVDEVVDQLSEQVDALADELAKRLKAGHTIFACGNGGSAADAQHFAAELVNRYLMDRKPYAAIALSTDTSVLTSIGNDYGYEQVFEKQIQALGRPGDVLIGITTSGNSENVVRAANVAKEKGLLTIGLTGGDGGVLKDKVDKVLCIASTSSTPRIQEGHEIIMHGLCERIEEQLG